MSPWGEDRGGVHGPTVWRALILLLVVAVALIGYTIPTLYSRNHDAVEATRTLSCRLGGFFVDQPIIQRPEQTNAQFRNVLGKADGFLHSLRDADCQGVGGVTENKIRDALDAIAKARSQLPPERSTP